METSGIRIIKSAGAARRAGVVPGDKLVGINGEAVVDFIDYQYFSALPKLTLNILDETGRHDVQITKRAEAPIGLDFGDALYPPERVCCNECIFCFVDQLPPGMRPGMYVRDDDWRYSVLFGNFITLTNLGEEEIRRIIARQASPINVSVHAADLKTRRYMLGNPKAQDILPLLKRLAQGGIRIHTQAVLVPGVNDDDVLWQTMGGLFALGENVRTFAAVPVGLTPTREGLTPIRAFTQGEARKAVALVERFAQDCVKKEGRRFAYASDELYHIAALPYPRYEGGEHQPQVGNGVGMYSAFRDGLEQAALALEPYAGHTGRITCVTGEAAHSIVGEMAAAAMQYLPRVEIRVLAAKNQTFGPTITVAGLLGGKDILNVLKNENVGLGLLIPADALREDCFIDDMPRAELEKALGLPVKAVANEADAFMAAVVDLLEDRT